HLSSLLPLSFLVRVLLPANSGMKKSTCPIKWRQGFQIKSSFYESPSYHYKNLTIYQLYTSPKNHIYPTIH
ncbi:hypothetical protein, partial [Bacillus pseudomycoides]|uniref:hypothetical protein n=1 Tax=Bacillus pseudomycoides TaxID=64104 RepID=UPI001E59027C